MAKKIKVQRVLTEEEKKAEAQAKEQEAQGIQDEFQAAGVDAVHWTQQHSGIVMGVLGLIVVVGLGVGAMQMTQNTSNRDASAAFDKAREMYEAPLGDAPAGLTGGSSEGPSFKDAKERSTAAKKAFEGVVADFGSSGPATLASLYVGHTSLALEEYDAAVKAYETFLDATSKSDRLRFLALDGLATALDAKGNRKDAIKRLEELISLPSKTSEDAALLRLAQLAKADGDSAKAKQAAERIVADFPESPLRSQADELLSSIAKGS